MAIGKININKKNNQITNDDKIGNKFSKKIASSFEKNKVLTHAKLQETIQHEIKQGNVQLIPLNKIVELIANGKPMHNRTTFSEESIEKLAINIKENKGKGIFDTGLLHPIVVRRVGESYERITGFRRCLAVKYNNEAQIPAIVIDVDDKTARTIRHSENAHREKLNDYDELISIIEELSYYTNKDFDYIVEFIKKSKYHYDKSKSFEYKDENLELLKNIESRVFQISSFGIKGLEKRLMILKMDKMLIDEMKNNTISFSNAFLIHKAKLDQENLEYILLYNRNSKPTVEELKNEIKSIINKKNKNIINPIDELKKSISSIGVSKYNKLKEDDKIKAKSIFENINNEINKLNQLFEKK